MTAHIVFLSPPIRLPLTSPKSLNCLLHPPPPIRAALSGAIAETLVHLTLYPLDTWKTHRHYTPHPTRHPLSPPLSPFAGVRIGLLGVALDAALFSLVYHTLQKLTRHLPTAPATLASAAISSLVSTAVDAPFTLARDRIRLGLATSWRDAWRAAVSTNWRGLYAGAGEAVVRDVPFEAIEYATYEHLKIICARVKPVTPLDMLALGMITGAVTGALISPLDLVVTRCVADPARYRGVLSTIGKVVAEVGVPGVFAGVTHKVVREMASSAMFFCVYDSLRGDD